jgi:hypothetical protein
MKNRVWLGTFGTIALMVSAPACIAVLDWDFEAGPGAGGICYGSSCTEKSCIGLSANCGPSSNENCCVSSIVTGGTYNRSNDAMYPATVSNFRLD